MKIETIFSLGQEVYTMEDGRPVVTKVQRVNVFVGLEQLNSQPEQLEQYELFGCTGYRFAREVFASRDQLFDHLRDKIESLI